MHLVVGQPIVAAAGFQPARKGRLKGGCGQDCPPHKNRQNFTRTTLAGLRPSPKTGGFG